MQKGTALVTGASRGIGAAVARAFAQPGRSLVLMARSEAALEQRCLEARRRGARAEAAPVDFAEVAGVRRVLDRIAKRHPVVDSLVLNAGIANDVAFENSDPDAFEREFRVNYLAPVQILRSVLPGMVERGSGRVVVVGSLTSFVPFPGNASYAASKAALLSFVRSMRLELAGTGVHLGVVLPGFTNTDMTRGRRTLLPALSPDDVAKAVLECHDRRRSVVVPGLLNRAAARLFGAFPGPSDQLLDKFGRFLLPARA